MIRNINMVYWIAQLMGEPKPSHDLAIKIANQYSFQELDRVYRYVYRRRYAAKNTQPNIA